MNKDNSAAAPADAHDPLMPPKWLAADLGISLPTFWRLRRAGRYPELVEISPGRCGQFLSVHGSWKRARPRKSAAQPAPEPAEPADPAPQLARES